MQTEPKTSRSSRSLRAGLRWGALVFVVGMLAYRAKFNPTAVAVHSIDRGNVVAEVMGTGTLEARVDATLSPKIQGRLAELFVDQNDPVRAGQLLARLDDADWKQLVAVAQAGHDAAKATVDRVRTDEARAKAVFQQAQLDHQRASELRRSNVAAQADLDKAVETLRVAEAEINRTQAAIAEAERQRIAAEKNLAYHRARLDDTQLLSPVDGLVVRRTRNPGDVVVPGGSILRLVATNELWISAWVDETAMAGLARGQKARVVFRSEPSVNRSGEVMRLGRETDRETREFLVDVRVAELPANWAVGQRAEVFIATAGRSDALRLPKAFLNWRDGKPGAFLARDGKAHWQPITLGLSARESVEVLTGLQEADRVIRSADPKAPLQHGQRVKAP